MKLEAITICVNYSDYLERIIPYNINYFDKWVIVTTYEDEDTLRICNKHDIWCVRTNAFNDPGETRDNSENKFNKGSAINKGLKHLDKDGWVIHFDADIIIPFDIKKKLKDLNKEYLYGCYRYRCPDMKTLKYYKETGNVDKFEFKEHWLDVGVGFFQLFNPECEALKGWVEYPSQYAHAGKSDRIFSRKWDKNTHLKCLDNVIHLEHGGYGENWEGRTTKRFK
jgi:hypothetical protein